MFYFNESSFLRAFGYICTSILLPIKGLLHHTASRTQFNNLADRMVYIVTM